MSFNSNFSMLSKLPKVTLTAIPDAPETNDHQYCGSIVQEYGDRVPKKVLTNPKSLDKSALTPWQGKSTSL